MLIFTLSMLIASQASSAIQSSNEDIGYTAPQCFAFYKGVEIYVAKTYEEKDAAKKLQNFMIILSKEHGVTPEQFLKTMKPYKLELDQNVAKNNRTFLESERVRCSTFAAREAREREANRNNGDPQTNMPN